MFASCIDTKDGKGFHPCIVTEDKRCYVLTCTKSPDPAVATAVAVRALEALNASIITFLTSRGYKEE